MFNLNSEVLSAYSNVFKTSVLSTFQKLQYSLLTRVLYLSSHYIPVTFNSMADTNFVNNRKSGFLTDASSLLEYPVL